jgi:hypothetical protein
MSDSIHTLPSIPMDGTAPYHDAGLKQRAPPALPFHTRGWRWLKPIGYIILLLILNLVVPLVAFYELRSRTS